MPGLTTTPAARRRSYCLTTDANVTFNPKRGHWIYHPRCPGDIPPPVIYFGGETTNRAARWERIGPNFYGEYEDDEEDNEFPDVWRTCMFGNERVRRCEEASVAVEEEEEEEEEEREEGGDGAGGEEGGEERGRGKLTYEELRERELEQMRLLPALLEPVRLWEVEEYEEEYEEGWKADDYDYDDTNTGNDEDELPWRRTLTRDLEWW